MAKNTSGSKKPGGKSTSWRNTAAAMDFAFGANVKKPKGKGKKPAGGGSV